MSEVPALSVVVPIHNAEAFIEERLGELSRFLVAHEFDHEIVAVDDGSTDGTPDVLGRLTLPHLKTVLTRPNRGKFAAVGRGMVVATGRCRIFTDADIPYDLNAVFRAVHLVADRGFHVAVGDRTLPESAYADDLGLLRRIATETFTHCVRLFVTSGLGDTQCGFKAVRGDVADVLFPLMQEPGFAGDVELLYIALKHNLDIKRIPVQIRYHGPSTVKPFLHGALMLRSLVDIRRRHRRGDYESAALRRLSGSDDWGPAGRASGNSQ